MRVSVVATGIEAEEISRPTTQNSEESSVLAVEEIVDETVQNLSLEEPIVAKTQEIFDQVDSEISANIELDQPLGQENYDLKANSKLEETLEVQPQSPPGVPSPETLARLKAAVIKETDQKNSLPNSEENLVSERPKFGISSLISRMSRSETISSGSGVSRKEPNLNADVNRESEFDDLEQEKIEVPAFLRRQAN